MDCVSLFSGALGLDLGLELAGFESKVCVENNPAARKTISRNKPSIAVFGDITSVDGRQLSQSAPTLVVGGPPCQSFSTMGKRLSFSDPRGMMPFQFGRIVQETKPRFFVMENVKGMATTLIEDGRTALQVVLDEFKSLEYKIIHQVVNAVDYGVPQFRERVLLIGSRDDEDIFIPFPTHFQKHQSAAFRWRTLSDAIKDMPLGEFNPFSESRIKWLEKIPTGGNWKSLGEADQREAMGGAYLSGGGKTGFFRRLSMTEPCPTLVTSPDQKSTILCHPTETRPLSVQEYARIQMFPDDWIIEGSLAARYKQIGNAVPVGLGKAIGEMLVSVISGNHSIESKRIR